MRRLAQAKSKTGDHRLGSARGARETVVESDGAGTWRVHGAPAPPLAGLLDLALQLEDAMMLPFVLFADADGGFLGGYSGVVTPPYLIQTLDPLVAEKPAN